MRSRDLPLLLILFLALSTVVEAAPVADGQQPPATSTERGSSSTSTALRFAIEADPGVPGPLYVELNGESGQVGWVTARVGGERIFFRERCEIADCGVPASVCGAAIPLIRDIAATTGNGRVEFEWDGTTSALDAGSQCESRVPAPEGTYDARFCLSHEANFSSGDPSRAAQGRLTNPTCVDRSFTLRDREVILTVVGTSSVLSADSFR